jgi:hypothetical protein
LHFTIEAANQKKGDPDEAPSLREGSRRACGVSRRYIHVPARNSRTSCARPCGLVLRPAAASYGVEIKIKSHGKSSTVGWACKSSAPLTTASTAGLISPAYASASIRHPGERRDPALALAVDIALALGSRRWRRAAQSGVGERRDCLRPWMAEFRAGRRPASSAGNRSGFIGSAPASGRLLFGYFLLAKQEKVTRLPKAVETGRETSRSGSSPSSHRDRSPRMTDLRGSKVATRVQTPAVAPSDAPTRAARRINDRERNRTQVGK